LLLLFIAGVCIMQLTELAADYQDEHTTSTQTAEMLEAETTERIRLDKEVKELQVFILMPLLLDR